MNVRVAAPTTIDIVLEVMARASEINTVPVDGTVKSNVISLFVEVKYWICCWPTVLLASRFWATVHLNEVSS